MSTILVTGALGNIGGRVVASLAQTGHRVRAIVRRPRDAKLGAAVELVEGSYDDAATLRRAFDGVAAALLVTAGPSIPQHDGALATAARAAGVGRIVKLSVHAARADGSEVPAWHAAGETKIVATGVPHTFLRPAGFASNALRWATSLRAGGTAYGAFGDAAIPVIHPDDIADVAAQALTAPGRESEILELTGPEPLTAARQVAILSEVAGRPFRYVDVPDDAALRGMIESGMPAPFANAMLHLVQSVRAAPPPVTGTVERLLGRPPRTFHQWVSAHVEAFR
jgi:uncharacterized protein YbjT (DUF2867 family)